MLSANETLLRTLLSYCSLHGASGGGLASVRMELVLLLQELQQEKTQQQLLSPLPFPTTLPLLSASVACNKTVVADPVRHLQVRHITVTPGTRCGRSKTINEIFCLVSRSRHAADTGGITQSTNADEKHALLRSIYNEGFGGSFKCLHLSVALRF